MCIRDRDKTEYFDVANNPNREANNTTTRKVAFTNELWIENEDFAEEMCIRDSH